MTKLDAYLRKLKGQLLRVYLSLKKNQDLNKG
jgi:hypothetical protein